MKPNDNLMKLWGIFLALGVVVFVLQIIHISLQLKNKSYKGESIENQEKEILKKII